MTSLTFRCKSVSCAPFGLENENHIHTVTHHARIKVVQASKCRSIQ